MKNRIVFYGVLAAFLVGYAGFLWYCSSREGVTKTQFEQLEIGMTKRQVRSVLGFWPDATHHWVKGQVHEDWRGDEGGTLLAFDDQDRLIWKDWDVLWRRPRLTLSERFANLGEGWWWVVRE